jgi:hypothetical protein
MSIFSIESVLTQKIFKNLIDMNYHVIIDELIQKKNNIEIKEKNEIKMKEEIKDVQQNVIQLSLIPLKAREENIVSLSLKHPKDCQPRIPIKDRCSLLRPNLKTTDDIFDVQSSINYILAHSEDIEYKIINPYCKWECENFSEEYGYTHFYVVVSLITEEDVEPYYAIEVQRMKGSSVIIHYILHQLKDSLNIL